ncbi:hypothetical protein BDV18DRAFT_140874 [Aspergillus unguis]
MGWLTLRRAHPKELCVHGPAPSAVSKISAYCEHTEHVSLPDQIEPLRRASTFQGKTYPLHDPSTPDSDLPYIDPSVVLEIEKYWKKTTSSSSDQDSFKEGNTPAWIVVDNVIYDCTSFQHTHPGGSVVIRSFVGQDCSWQFWRFHGKRHMDESGRELRIGRTSGIQNRFKEPPRYVGSSSLGDDW